MAGLPTLYEYYTGSGIISGLSADQPYFTLNNKNITIYSGAMHYFRVPQEYWRDRLRKMRAAGLNTVETYVPWNLHEPQPGVYDFGEGGSDFQHFLHLEKFLKTAQEEDLLAIVRPGPYICSEWEFGGFPSWLLREKDIKVRTSQPTYMKHVTRYFNVLLPILAALQFTRGGPVVAFQVENEYGSTDQSGIFKPDKKYLGELVDLFVQNGIVELLVSSDSPASHGSVGTLVGVLLQTANFAVNPEKEFEALRRLQPNKPFMAMEFWSGWFDHWAEEHHISDKAVFFKVLESILQYPASVNMYMFHGGTNWGFLNGANINSEYEPDTTSYDYDAPLTEAGDYTEKYSMVKQLLQKYNKVQLKTPLAPAVTPRTAYPSINVTQQMSLAEIIRRVPETTPSKKLLPMELLPINNGSGQSYGYVVYKKTGLNIASGSVLKIGGYVCDTVMVLVNGILKSKQLRKPEDLDGFGFWKIKDGNLSLGGEAVTNATLELVVENSGRNNFGYLDTFVQFKGLWQGGVYINGQELTDWEITPIELKSKWTRNLMGWRPSDSLNSPGPSLYKASFVTTNPQDTYIDMREWMKGIVIINGFVLGRYASTIGPQQTLYLPAPLQKKGLNEIVVFEHFVANDKIKFSADPIFYTPKKNRLVVKKN